MISSFLYHFARIFLKIFFALFYKHKVSYVDRDSFPKGGALIVSNHCSFFDPTIIGASLKERIYYIARSTLFRSWFGKAIRTVGAIPVKRGGINLETFREIGKCVKNGGKVLLFPEGTRSKDGHLQEMKPGVTLIFEQVDCPIIPVYIKGSYDIWNAKRKLPRLTGRLHVLFGKPIYSQTFASLPKKESREALKAKLREALEELERKVIDLPN